MMMMSEEGVAESEYLRSTTQLYSECNQGLRPLMPRQNLLLDSDQGVEAHRENSWQGPSQFIIDQSFRRLLNRFEHQYNSVFLDIPCGYCGYLSSSRSTCWLSAQEAIEKEDAFELKTHLHLNVYRDSKGRVAICRDCQKKPRGAVNAGPWPSILVNIPKRS